MARCDVFVFLDHVQFEKQSWQNRNRLKGSDGKPFWLTVPVASHKLETRLCDIRIAHGQNRWRRKHLQSIRMSLAVAPYFKEVFPHVEAWFAEEFDFLAEFTIGGIKRFSQLLGIAPRLVRSSELCVSGAKVDVVLDILRTVGADSYRANAGAKDYTEAAAESFSASRIDVSFQEWEHPVYSQAHGDFVSHLAFVDALCYLGIEQTKEILSTKRS